MSFEFVGFSARSLSARFYLQGGLHPLIPQMYVQTQSCKILSVTSRDLHM